MFKMMPYSSFLTYYKTIDTTFSFIANCIVYTVYHTYIN